MIERIDSPDNVVALRAVGKVSREDYEAVLEPAIDALIAAHDAIRFVYVIDDAFDGYSVSGAWEDSKFGFAHLTKWKRCAIVTDHDWIRHGVGMFRWMMPGDLKVFDVGDVDGAVAWAAA
jgi:SpoIIAA-like